MNEILNLKSDIEKRLSEFTLSIIRIAEMLENIEISNQYSTKLLGQGTSPALHFENAKKSDSRIEFVASIKKCIKDLKATKCCLILIRKGDFLQNPFILNTAIEISDELTNIFVKSIRNSEIKKLFVHQKINFSS
jgi:hypothetical protein